MTFSYLRCCCFRFLISGLETSPLFLLCVVVVRFYSDCCILVKKIIMLISNNTEVHKIEFNSKIYTPDIFIKLPLSDDFKFQLKDCICLFSVRNPKNPLSQMIVIHGEKIPFLDETNINHKYKGYLPEHVLCFTKTEFPLKSFLESDEFKNFGL